MGSVGQNRSASFLVPLVKELMDSNIFPILFGGNEDFTLTQYHAYRFKKQIVNMAVIDERINYLNPRSKEQSFLNKIIDSRTSHLFNMSVLGHQSHFTSQEVLRVFQKNNFEAVRLGKLRGNVEYAEPFLRDADMISFNLNAVRSAECPGVVQPSPSGFFTEEICQLARYAGMSEKSTSVGFYGYAAEKDINQQSAHVVAQLIWYCIDGFFSRKNDYPKSMDGLVEYIVDSKKTDYALTFWKSEKTGRWWMQVPIKTKKKLLRHQLIPCTYQDYQRACREEIPERLINAFRRFS
ncbi:MAG: arginase family protein [Bacteroidota bacterium]